MSDLAKVGRATERREGERLPCFSSVKVYPDGYAQDHFTLPARNLAEGGVFLATGLLFDVGELFDLEFQVPERETPVRLRGRVTRVNGNPWRMTPGLAVAFGDLPDADWNALQQLV